MTAEAAAPETAYLHFDALVDLLGRILEVHGAPADVAHELAHNCASAERDGALSHGVFRMPSYVSTLHSGYVDAKAIPQIDDVAPSMLHVDARNGFAQPALAKVKERALDKVCTQGLCIVATHDSHHLGALWLDVEPFARQGLVALTFVNGISRVAPHGGHRPFYGTNPMALAVPRHHTDPLVFDQASSAMSYGEVKLAQDHGETVPPGIGIDQAAQPTVDPKAILEGGALLPFGKHKGSSISMMVELMAGALTGAAFSFQVDRRQHHGAQTSRSGQLLCLIDPTRLVGAGFPDRVEELVQGLHDSGQARLPGDRRYENRRRSHSVGIPIAAGVRARLDALLDPAARP
ncbi:MAG: Ldh family oxidoreductase [bacterium]|nr:Ldh family oxidoreductase [Betaproteobacteria bacterium]